MADRLTETMKVKSPKTITARVPAFSGPTGRHTVDLAGAHVGEIVDVTADDEVPWPCRCRCAARTPGAAPRLLLDADHVFGMTNVPFGPTVTRLGRRSAR